MTQHERSQLGKKIANLAVFFNRPMNQAVLSMMIDVLQDLPFEDVDRAYDAYLKDPKNNFFPMPGTIRAMVRPEPDDNSLAQLAAAAVVEAVKRHGYSQPADAREMMGELAWTTVQRLGGWVHVCESMNNNQLGIFTAQARDLAKSQLTLARAGKLNEAPMLPEPSSKVAALAGMAVRRIEGGK